MIVKSKKWIIEHQWLTFIISALVVAMVFTLISLWLYRASGAANLDLSRPGYEKVRADVQDDSDGTKPFSPNGKLDDAAVADFRSRYETVKARLDQMNSYDNTAITDENLGLASGQNSQEPVQ
jgi:hypothetical protein